MSKAKAGFLLLLAAFLYFYNTWGYHLWKPDEPRYAEVAREMVSEGSYLIPVLGGEVYYDKPPLFFLFIAASYKVFGGASEFAARATSAIFSILVVLMVFLWGYRFLGASSFTGALILATSFEFVWIARRVNIDNTLTFFVLVALFSFLSWWRERKGFFLFIFYLSMGLGLLVKGPLALIVPMGSALLFLVVKRDNPFSIHPIKGVVLALLFPILWLLYGYLKVGPSYPEVILKEHVFGMYFTGWSHHRPFYYYFANFPLNFLPWTFFIPSAVALLRKDGSWKKDEILFFILSFSFTFLFLSLSKAKRELYLLPVYPCASLVLGWAIDRMESYSIRRVALFFLVFLLVLSLSVPHAVRKFAPRLSPCVFFFTLSMLVPFLLGSLGYTRRRNMLYLFPFFTLSVFLFSARFVFPYVDRFKYPAEVIEKLKGENAPTFLYSYRNYQFHFYLKRSRIPTVGDKEVKDMVARGEPFYLVVRGRHLKPYMLSFKVSAISELWRDRVYLLRFCGYKFEKTGG